MMLELVLLSQRQPQNTPDRFVLQCREISLASLFRLEQRPAHRKYSPPRSRGIPMVALQCCRLLLGSSINQRKVKCDCRVLLARHSERANISIPCEYGRSERR